MAIKKSLFIIAFLITLVIFSGIIIIGGVMNDSRKNYVDEQMQIIADLNELQVYSLMTDVYGDKIACLAFKKKLSQWDESLWNLGAKLEDYRVATEEFQKDKFYREQKRRFNENQVLYLLFLTKVKDDCNLDQNIIVFFYQNSADCRKCDDQSFILTDIKMDLEENISIFALDTDLGLTNIDILIEYYEVNEYPCIIINEEKYCGIIDKKFIMDNLN
jgi:hypothetical protein